MVENVDMFYKELPDGVDAMCLVDQVPGFENRLMLLAGGNCNVQVKKFVCFPARYRHQIATPPVNSIRASLQRAKSSTGLWQAIVSQH